MNRRDLLRGAVASAAVAVVGIPDRYHWRTVNDAWVRAAHIAGLDLGRSDFSISAGYVREPNGDVRITHWSVVKGK